MADLINQGLAWLKGQRELHMSASIEYRKGASIFLVSATVGKSTFNLNDSVGAQIVIKTRDFIVGADILQIEPEAGDKIESNGEVFEVVCPGGEPCWRWSDAYNRTKRIHTQFIGE
jgi:hypothetical protein